MSLRIVSGGRLLPLPGMGVFLKTGQVHTRTIVPQQLTSGVLRSGSPPTSPAARAERPRSCLWETGTR